eukprot:GHVL01014795.1.p1 GENE.GHVL01014795.1~~GHVL01014795.1.p1  ORF type:complete len:438 (+),score=57.35 GHVL01014795.1:56-1369(+)
MRHYLLYILLIISSVVDGVDANRSAASIISDGIEMWNLYAWRIIRPKEKFSPRVPKSSEILMDSKLVTPIVKRLQSRIFFSYFKVDLSGECPFWAAKRICESPEKCHICECGEDEIPSVYKTKPTEHFVDRELQDNFSVWSNKQENTNFWLDIKDNKSPVYVDLRLNRPSYTAYRGEQIWNLIYQENCFPDTMTSFSHEDECNDESNFYRLLSGLQSNIAALSSEYHYVDSENPQSISFFKEKLGREPYYISNLYFTFSLLLRTLCRVSPIMTNVPFETGSKKDDLRARADVFQLLNQTFSSCETQYTSVPLWEVRATEALEQFQNISRILDCVECEKCRLHGKLKTTALYFVVKEGAGINIKSLERNEVTALINSIAYFAEAIEIIERMDSRLRSGHKYMILAFSLPFVVVLMCVYIIFKKTKKINQSKISKSKDE